MALVLATFIISLTPVFAQVDIAWVRTNPGGGWICDIAVDTCGNVYVTGQSGTGPDYDYLTIKYYPNGDTAWVRTYDGPGNDEMGVLAIAVHGCENIYVTGPSGTIGYNANGDQLWVGNYCGVDIGVDSFGNIYVTEESNIGDYITAKYYANGDVAWVRTYDGPAHGRDGATAIAVDDSGNAYVTGFSEQIPPPYNNHAYLTIKYLPNGNIAPGWPRIYNYSDDVAYAIAVDDSGYVYVTGWSYGILDNDKRL
jgi:hypothetical protein